MTAVIFLGLLLFLLPREKAVIPFIIMACFIPTAQRMVILGMDFNLIRVLFFLGWVRIIITNEIRSIKVNGLDAIIIIWALVQIIMYSIQNRTFSSFVYKLGVSSDIIGMYFMFRAIIRSKEDVRKIIKYFILISFPILLFFIYERFTRHNIFSVFGGVPAETMVREGRLRVQGAFSHPILGGCFWASILPFVFAEFYQEQSRKGFLVMSMGGIFLIVILSASSTPILSTFFCFFGIFLFRFRKYMRVFLLLAVLGIIGLSLVMKAPVYHLIARIDLTGGSTGWHRFNLINQAVINWKSWFLFGVNNIDSWGVFNNDVTNQYILEAIRGGILSLFLFFVLIAVAFIYCGRIVDSKIEKNDAFFNWMIGVSFAMHAINFIAVSYFGQIWMIWYLCVAMIGSLYQWDYPLKKNNRIYAAA